MSQKSDRLTFLPKLINEKKHASNVWSNFKEALIDNKRTSIFKCNSCFSLYIYKAQTGTSTLARNTCSVKPKDSHQIHGSNNRPISSMLRKHVPKSSIEQLNRDVTLGLAKDLQPLHRVECEGFMHIAQALINFGSIHGQQSAKDVINHRTNLKRNVLPKVCGDLLQDVKSSIEKCNSYLDFAYTADMWTEKYHSTSFLSLSLHLIDDIWRLKRYNLGMEKFEEEKKTTVNVRSECEKILSKYFQEHAESI